MSLPTVKLPPLKWSHLRALGSSRVVQTSYIWLLVVPVAARILERFPRHVVLPGFDPALEIRLELPFSWLVFYFSALAFSVGSLLYYWRCPRLLRLTTDFGDFERQGRRPLEIEHEAARLVSADRSVEIILLVEDGDHDKLQRAYWELVQKLEVLRPTSAQLAAGVFGVGLAGTLFVTVQGLIAVLRMLLG